jgi:hypothetical protein
MAKAWREIMASMAISGGVAAYRKSQRKYHRGEWRRRKRQENIEAWRPKAGEMAAASISGNKQHQYL